MSLHDGHRDRLRKRYMAEGLDHFTEVQVLELMLFYCIPRKDTNELAHRLLERFGSLSQVLDTRQEDLMQVEGIGENAALFLSLFPSVARYYDTNQASRVTVLKDVDECGKYLLGYFKNRINETVFLLCLDAKRKVLCCQMVGEGSVNFPVFLPKLLESGYKGDLYIEHEISDRNRLEDVRKVVSYLKNFVY